jgi:hypothetical protein
VSDGLFLAFELPEIGKLSFRLGDFEGETASKYGHVGQKFSQGAGCENG